MNPCPCGYFGHQKINCHCTQEQIRRYRHKISGPLLDRIDLQVNVPANTLEVINAEAQQGESSATVKLRVCAAQQYQKTRQGCLNADLNGQQLIEHCTLSTENRQLMARATDKLGLSARAYHRCLKVARTIADLEQAHTVESKHLLEALHLRKMG